MKTATQPAIPATEPLTLAAVEPEFAAMEQKLRELNAEERALFEKLTPITARHRAGLSGGYDVGQVAEQVAFREFLADEAAGRPRRPSLQDRAIQALGELGPKVEPKTAPPRPQRIEAEVMEAREISRRIDVVRTARALVERPYLNLRRKASAKIVKMVDADYRRRADRMIAALLELGEAMLDEAEFVESLERRGIDTLTLRRVPRYGIGADPRDSDAPLRRILRTAEEFGLFDRAKLPDRWRR